MNVLDAIASRRSQPKLAAPAPDDAVLARVLEAAGQAPDHRLLRPWRYLVIRGEALTTLGEVFVRAVSAVDPARAALEADRLRGMPQRAPLIIVAVLSAREHPGVPDWEQWLSLGAGIQNLLLALHAEGFAGMWRTGEMARAAVVDQALGLAPGERIGGFVYVGMATSEKAAPVAPQAFWQEWSAP